MGDKLGRDEGKEGARTGPRGGARALVAQWSGMGQGWHGSLWRSEKVTGRSDCTGQVPGPRRGELGFGVSALLRGD